RGPAGHEPHLVDLPPRRLLHVGRIHNEHLLLLVPEHAGHWRRIGVAHQVDHAGMHPGQGSNEAVLPRDGVSQLRDLSLETGIAHRACRPASASTRATLPAVNAERRNDQCGCDGHAAQYSSYWQATARLERHYMERSVSSVGGGMWRRRWLMARWLRGHRPARPDRPHDHMLAICSQAR